jgi:hypothetical protein
MKSALLVRGGWLGHEPFEVSEILGKALREHGFQVEFSETLDVFKDKEKLSKLDLIVPLWTMGKIERDQLAGLLEAVKGGVGIGGVHGGMGDAFREATEYQYMVGGQWVAHPGNDGVRYMVHIEPTDSPITAGLKDFEVVSEHYYMHIDPAIRVLATTKFGDVVMPVTWTKHYGKGRVFYCSLGHVAKVFDIPEALTMTVRGLLWAAEKD